MADLQQLSQALSGKKTYIGKALLGLLSIVVAIDTIMHGAPSAERAALYAAIAGGIEAICGIVMRFGVAKSQKAAEDVKQLLNEQKAGNGNTD